MTVEIRLKELRKARNLSQNALARVLEMSLANVQKIEYNKAKAIPLDTLDKLCSVLECEVGELLVRVPDNEPEKHTSKSSHQNLEEVPAHKSKTKKQSSKSVDLYVVSKEVA